MEQMEPPPYDGLDAADTDTVHPVILVLSGRLIYSEGAGSPALYELDHDVGFLSRSDHKVSFSRHERRVRASQHGGGGVRASNYQRHLFNLESPHAVTSTSRYAFFLTSVSRKTLGHVGLKR